jgi:hypothetical protein
LLSEPGLHWLNEIDATEKFVAGVGHAVMASWPFLELQKAHIHRILFIDARYISRAAWLATAAPQRGFEHPALKIIHRIPPALDQRRAADADRVVALSTLSISTDVHPTPHNRAINSAIAALHDKDTWAPPNPQKIDTDSLSNHAECGFLEFRSVHF